MRAAGRTLTVKELLQSLRSVDATIVVRNDYDGRLLRITAAEYQSTGEVRLTVRSDLDEAS